MAPEKAPAYQWYPKDAETDEAYRLMTCEELGVYERLRDHQWLEGSLPPLIEQLALVVGHGMTKHRLERIWPKIVACFPDDGSGRLVNARLERQREELATFKAERKQSGSRGGLVKGQRLRVARLSAARRIATHTEAEWLEMVEFFERRCVKCGRSDMAVEADHIRSLYQGGHDGISNIQPLCAPCNGGKGPERVDYRLLTGKQLPSKWIAEPETSANKHVAIYSSASATATASTHKERVYGTRTPGGVLEGQLPRDHLRHRVCGRVCLHGSQFQQFVAKLGGLQGEAEETIQRWAEGILIEWNMPPKGTTAIQGTNFQWWDARWEEWQGRPTATKRLTEDPAAMDAGVLALLRKDGTVA